MNNRTIFSIGAQLLCIVVTFNHVIGYKKYRTCADVKKDLGTGATDQEYPLFITSNVAVPIYCYGLSRSDRGPAEYITLRSGRSSNFASFYDNVGDRNSCADKFPRQLYDRRGRSEYSRIGVEIYSLVVQTGDFTFANQTGHRQVRYGNGGDMFSISPTCQPMGSFQIDLTGTPFTLVNTTQWTWQGRYVNDDVTQGKVRLDDHSYLGCFKPQSWTLTNGMNSGTHMTILGCKQYCRRNNYDYCGIKEGSSCSCGSIHDRHGATTLAESSCSSPCSGNTTTMCGGPNGIYSIYKTGIPQRYTVRCGGYPGQCFAITSQSFKMETLQLDVMNGQHICQKRNPCLNEGGCLAVNNNDYKCLCYNGYTGARCEQILDTQTVRNSTCPTGYQAEACSCQTATCTSAMFVGDICQAKPNPSVTCRPASPGRVYLFNVQGRGSISCPDDSDLVGCSQQGSDQTVTNNYGRANISGNVCSSSQSIPVQARCKKYDCGCRNDGHCNKVTGLCECPPSYYGDKCEMFDFCGFYEATHNNTPACSSGGICTAVQKRAVKAIGGDMAGDTCIFPFDYGAQTYYSCVEDNSYSAGPPFACSGQFDRSSSYIDLGQWSPGQKYTIAAWVKPAVIDTIRRTIAGGASDCNDFGFNLNSGTFRGFLKMSQECTEDLDAGKPYVRVDKWYMVAISSNASHAMIYQDGKLRDANTVLLNHLPTTSGFRIGGELCCPNNNFHGMIKTVKVWNHDLTAEEINTSMYNIGTANSTVEALHSGLVGHWELGEVLNSPCSGSNVTNHGGNDWILQDGVYITGVHCNIKRFLVPKGSTVLITPFDGTKGGKIDITAETIEIDGILDGGGAGYRGAPGPNITGSGGLQGESYNGVGHVTTTANRGGGGGGYGAMGTQNGVAGPGGGATYKANNDYAGYSKFPTRIGARGQPYGTDKLDMMYLGSGGGSGGNSKELAYTPRGGKGGNGGGAVKLTASRSIVIKGVVKVNGENGQGDVDSHATCLQCPSACFQKTSGSCITNSTTGCWDLSGPGGGGSGGSIYLSAEYVDIGYTTLWIQGGKGGMGGKQCGGYGSEGRVRIDSNMFKGQISNTYGSDTFYRGQLQELFVDYSQTGQKQIDYTNTVYGNEVYRGCFIHSTTKQVLSVPIATTQVTKQQMTPQYCQQMCRQRKYMFSGTENGQTCYCDNHLVVSSKAPDSDCSVACLGDPLQKCGGVNRIQVFGPPPAAPAQGFNVRPMCQPWCVTADALSSQPKWGTCVDQSKDVSSWDTKCECPPGKRGQACDQDCPMWSYGPACRRQCTCNHTNSAGCVPSTGVCKCKPGYQGDQCEKMCSPGYYGENCANQCTCRNNQNSECDPLTGACSCQAGWYGNSCNFPCQQNTFGKNCSSTCQCSKHGTCNPVDGTCQCRSGYNLPFCVDKCDPSRYGQDCLQACNCSNQPCEAVTGVCQCGPGYTGTRCEQLCPFGTWGQACARKCGCQFGFTCDHITGECNCGRGFIGENCELQCPALLYGQDCENSCKCIQNQTSICDAVTGECFCLPGYQGLYCEKTCDLGYYGDRCQGTCNCYNGATCEPVKGKCSCAPGFTGDQCQTVCPPGTYGKGCQNRCSNSCPSGHCNTVDGSCNCQKSVACSCPNNTWSALTQCDQICSCVNGGCNPQDGSCTCLPGWTGNHCEMPCPSDKFGQGCAKACLCVHGTCDPISGSCKCASGYSGTTCNATCPSGTYGPNCIYPCAQCGPYSYPGCEPHTGACLCSDGYTGATCDRPCPEGAFGAKCAKNCSCQNGAYCDSVTGKCQCSAGFYGTNCENTCQAGYWGMNCASQCSCGPYGDGCSPREGICRCKPGFLGVKCRQSCPSGFYGQNCTTRCNCDPFSSMCSPIDGTCLCNAGYKGQYCDQACGSGYWGKNCSQPCLCNDKGTCNPFTGECDCEPGYKGDQCQTQCDQDVYWGRNCANQCMCNGAHCDHRDGTCRCPPGKTGHQCEQGCDSQHFGFQCAQLCGCQNSGQCDPVTGACRCQPGWSGQFCSEACPTGYYGNDCSLSCPECQNGGSCDSLSGTCNCVPGFGGPLCNSSLQLVTATERHAAVQKLVSQSGIHFTSAQLAGLIVGFIVGLVIVAVLTALLTRRHFFGRFGSAPGAIKFKGEEDEDDSANKAGFSNPVLEEMQLESRQDLSHDSGGGQIE